MALTPVYSSSDVTTLLTLLSPLTNSERLTVLKSWRDAIEVAGVLGEEVIELEVRGRKVRFDSRIDQLQFLDSRIDKLEEITSSRKSARNIGRVRRI